MRWIVGGKAVERQAASTSQMGRFETEHLASDENFAALNDLADHHTNDIAVVGFLSVERRNVLDGIRHRQHASAHW